MNRDQFEGRWKQVSGKARQLWNMLLGDKAGVNAARQTQLAGGIQRRHGISKQEAERQLRDFMHRNRNWDPSRRAFQFFTLKGTS